MMPLFSKGSQIVLESLSFTKTLYAFDFDGTLAKIVRVPSDAKMNQTTESLLKELSKLVPVAIISGRSVADLKDRISFRPRFLIGNHGMEGLGDNPNSMTEAKQICGKWNILLKKSKFEAGIEIEDKTYSLAIHYRACRNKTRARNQIKLAIEKLAPEPRIILGKCVVNLIPPGAPHKGAAVLDLIRKSGMKHVFYIGDDDTDEDIFSLPYSAGQIMSIRVGKKKSSQAGYYIERQSEINRLIKILIKYHQPIGRQENIEAQR